MSIASPSAQSPTAISSAASSSCFCKGRVVVPDVELDVEVDAGNEKDNTSDTMTADDKNDSDREEQIVRTPTHYFGASSSVLDYILLSCEFDASYHDSLYQVSDYHTYDRHLINPIFDRDGESTDHGIVLVTLTLRS